MGKFGDHPVVWEGCGGVSLEVSGRCGREVGMSHSARSAAGGDISAPDTTVW